MKATQLSKWGFILLAMVFNTVAASVTPEVVAIYPRANELPENTLKFQIEFNVPMREGNFLQHIQLQSIDGESLSGVFFDNVYELWSNDHRQITILVDPGRVKTGLSENLKRGRAFIAGREYTLSILTSWRSLRGEPLQKIYTKTFTAIPEDLESPKVSLIKTSLLKPGSTDLLSITFPEPLDEQQIQEYVRIVSVREHQPTQVVQGKFTIESFGKVLNFVPRIPWEANQIYSLRIDTRLEDLASNNLQAKFDRPTTEKKGELHDQPFYYRTLNQETALGKGIKLNTVNIGEKI